MFPVPEGIHPWHYYNCCNLDDHIWQQYRCYSRLASRSKLKRCTPSQNRWNFMVITKGYAFPSTMCDKRSHTFLPPFPYLFSNFNEPRQYQAPATIKIKWDRLHRFLWLIQCMCTFYYPYQWRTQQHKRNMMWQCTPSITLSPVSCLFYIPNPQKTPESSLENCLSNRTYLSYSLHVSTQKGNSQRNCCASIVRNDSGSLSSSPHVFSAVLGRKTHVEAIRLPH